MHSHDNVHNVKDVTDVIENLIKMYIINITISSSSIVIISIIISIITIIITITIIIIVIKIIITIHPLGNILSSSQKTALPTTTVRL